MKHTLRTYAALFLALALTFTAHNAAAMRTMQDASGQVVICTGTGPEIIYVDDQGQPASPPHFCPDCVTLALDARTGLRQAVAIDQIQIATVGFLTKQPKLTNEPLFRLRARAPPVGV